MSTYAINSPWPKGHSRHWSSDRLVAEVAIAPPPTITRAGEDSDR
ncbi:hypothetical protein [Nodosilinea sp. P-1105]|nr:hypothetical protein [Nodosilinea sp. P-1105]